MFYLVILLYSFIFVNIIIKQPITHGTPGPNTVINLTNYTFFPLNSLLLLIKNIAIPLDSLSKNE